MLGRHLDDLVLVTEDEIREGMRFLYSRAKLACEGGGAAGVAALLAGKVDVAGRTGVACIISGGNVSPEVAAEVLAERPAATVAGEAVVEQALRHRELVPVGVQNDRDQRVPLAGRSRRKA